MGVFPRTRYARNRYFIAPAALFIPTNCTSEVKVHKNLLKLEDGNKQEPILYLKAVIFAVL